LLFAFRERLARFWWADYSAVELTSTLENSTLFEKYPEYRKALQVASIPERVIQFRVTWENDKGEVRCSDVTRHGRLPEYTVDADHGELGGS
jgi:hypothetical protein